MSEVRRWTCNVYCGVPEAHSDGEVINLDDVRAEFVKSEDYDAAQAELSALREELADMQHWRDLALQFDNHRMTALWHLKTLAVNPSYAPAVSEFLASPPLPASEVVQRLTAAEQRNAELVELLKRIDRTPLDRWYRDALNVAVAAAIKPTESGASE